MLKIKAVKIEVNTATGLFGSEFTFKDGLNIIRGDNSTGKSSLFQSILYGLGFEELLGGRNEKTMQSVLKDQVEYPKGKFHQVSQSFIYLEIENKSTITIRRSVTGVNRKSQLMDVYDGPLITGNNPSLPSRPMYIHDKGGASDDLYGFHLYLTEFLDWDLPEAVNTKGELTRLFIQQVAPAFIIEQKSGWSDFFATIPYYGMRNTESRVIEFLLNLDVFENEKQKQHLSLQKLQLTTKWHSLYSQFQKMADKSGATLRGLDEQPSIINNFGGIYLAIHRDDREITLKENIELLRVELKELESAQTPTVGKNINKNEEKLKKLNDKLNQLSLNYEVLSPELSLDREKLRQYRKQLAAVIEDLRKNKGAMKVKSLGHILPSATADSSCPTCHQEIKDSLLPTEIKQSPMRLEDNIVFLEAQQKMIEVYVEGQENTIREKEKKVATYQYAITEARQEIRSIKKELVQDERLPSVLDIENRLNLRKRLEFFNKVAVEFGQLIDDLKSLSKELETVLSKQSNLPTDFFSQEDRKKLDALYLNFAQLLNTFNYQSKPAEAIRISTENYLPVAEKQLNDGLKLSYHLKFDSSASDFIRCLWAYYTTLLKISLSFKTNHPMLLIFDEPKQQDMSIESFKSFLLELSKFKSQQVLVFASFENSDDAFTEATKDVEFTLHRITEKLIKPIKN